MRIKAELNYIKYTSFFIVGLHNTKREERSYIAEVPEVLR